MKKSTKYFGIIVSAITIIPMFIFLSTSSLAQHEPDLHNEIDQKIMSRLLPKWLSCNQSEECTVIGYNCSGRIAFNKAYETQVSRVVFSVGTPAWAACNMPFNVGTVAVCGENQCKVRW